MHNCNIQVVCCMCNSLRSVKTKLFIITKVYMLNIDKHLNEWKRLRSEGTQLNTLIKHLVRNYPVTCSVNVSMHDAQGLFQIPFPK